MKIVNTAFTTVVYFLADAMLIDIAISSYCAFHTMLWSIISALMIVFITWGYILVLAEM